MLEQIFPYPTNIFLLLILPLFVFFILLSSFILLIGYDAKTWWQKILRILGLIPGGIVIAVFVLCMITIAFIILGYICIALFHALSWLVTNGLSGIFEAIWYGTGK